MTKARAKVLFKDVGEWLQAKERLAPSNWHTSRKENHADFEQRQSPSKWAAILVAIKNYQDAHDGQSPTDLMIAQDSGLSTGQVQYHLEQMAKAGLVKTQISANHISATEQPVREIIISAATKVVIAPATTPQPTERVKEAKIMSNETNNQPTDYDYSQYGKVKSRNRAGPTGRKTYLARAKEVASVITEYETAGHRLDGAILRHRVYGTTKGGGRLSYIINKMTKGGLLIHPKGSHSYRLTDAGRKRLLGQSAPVSSGSATFLPMGTGTAGAVTPTVASQSPPMAPPSIPAPDNTPIAAQASIKRIRPHDLLAGMDSLYMALELQRRGFTVTH